MLARVAALGVVLVAAGAYIQRASEAERIPSLPPLMTFPRDIAEWQGRDALAFPPAILQAIGVHEYLNRVYVRSDGSSVALYVGYYGSQRNGETIHSPADCMPGAGWEPEEHSRVTLPVTFVTNASRTIVVNEYVMRKDGDRQLVLYWFQSQGRVVASEYTSRIYMVYDALRRNRTDAALVRLLTPIVDSEPHPREAASGRARAFLRAMFPHLSALLPS